MNLKVIVHEAEEGGFWAEVPALVGCVSQGETMDEVMANIREAIEGCVSVDLNGVELEPGDRLLDIAV